MRKLLESARVYVQSSETAHAELRQVLLRLAEAVGQEGFEHEHACQQHLLVALRVVRRQARLPELYPACFGGGEHVVDEVGLLLADELEQRDRVRRQLIERDLCEEVVQQVHHELLGDPRVRG